MSSVFAGRAPALFIAHGGGPMPVLGDAGQKPLVEGWKQHRKDLFGSSRPRAIAVVSAHYERGHMHVGGAAKPEMIYDYGGFPAESYKLQYPAPGDPELAEHAVDLLRRAGLKATLDSDRGFDHGVFVPLMIMFPEATIPVIPISILRSQNPEEHIAAGAALSALRDEGVFILGSGSPSHNFAKFSFHPQQGTPVFGTEFNEKLAAVLTDPALNPVEKVRELVAWPTWPKASDAQLVGEADHLMPIFTCIGSSWHFNGKGPSTKPPRLVLKAQLASTAQYHFVFDD